MDSVPGDEIDFMLSNETMQEDLELLSGTSCEEKPFIGPSANYSNYKLVNTNDRLDNYKG